MIILHYTYIQQEAIQTGESKQFSTGENQTMRHVLAKRSSTPVDNWPSKAIRSWRFMFLLACAEMDVVGCHGGSFMRSTFGVGIHILVAPFEHVLMDRILREVHDIETVFGVHQVDSILGHALRHPFLELKIW